MATKVKPVKAAGYPSPASVDSPRDHWQLEHVLHDGGAGSWSAAEGKWDGEPRIGLRWNGGGEGQSAIGSPQSRGLPTWFIVPQELEDYVREALARRITAGKDNLKDDLLAIGRRCAALPDLDTRSPDEIIGYDEHGLPR